MKIEKIKQKAKIKTMSLGLSFCAAVNFETNITLLENDKILSEYSQVAKALNDFFSNVKTKCILRSK